MYAATAIGRWTSVILRGPGGWTLSDAGYDAQPGRSAVFASGKLRRAHRTSILSRPSGPSRVLDDFLRDMPPGTPDPERDGSRLSKQGHRGGHDSRRRS